MRKDVAVGLLLLLLSMVAKCNAVSLPGKPVLIKCRSPEKETFTCWWEPGYDGGLPTTHRLFYQKEYLDGTHECPDYHSAGRNSCFFDKRHTSIWVNYVLTVVASNALGNATSDPVEVDVMYIVQPCAPENVTVLVKDEGESPHLLVRWDPPPGTDTHSGWVTLIYQLRVKREADGKWMEYMSGKQTHYSVYSLRAGEVYLVQVRCKLDHGYWSEWSNATYREVPQHLLKEGPLNILVSIFSAFALIVSICTLIAKRKCVRQCLLPPVPGPKIRDFDAQLLKSGRPKDDLSALIINHSFPPVMACKDQMVEYLVVSDGSDGPLTDSQKTQLRKSLAVLNGLHLHPRGCGGEPTLIQTDAEKACTPTEGDVERPQNAESSGSIFCRVGAPQSPSQISAGGHFTEDEVENSSNHGGKRTAEDCVAVATDGSYVELQRQEKTQVVDERQEDYSRISGLSGDNVLILQREISPLGVPCKERSSHAVCAKHHLTAATAEEDCTELLDNGYVETVSLSHRM